MASESLIIHQLGLLLLIIALFSLGVKILRQPIIIGYVLSGMLFSFLFLDNSISEIVLLFGELGIIFLLFAMGIEFDIKNLKTFGKGIFIACFLQSTLFLAIGFGVSQLFSLSLLESLYIGIVFMFSSTLLVVKLLEDRFETLSLHGRLIITTLILQDIIAIISITALQIINSQSIQTAVLFPIYGILLFLIAFIVGKYFINHFLKIAHQYPELLLIFSIGMCFLFAQIATILQYSASIGAFIGGLILGVTIYKDDLIAKLSSLIIFFNMLFFVGLGFQMNFDISMNFIYMMIVLLLLSIILKPLIFYFTYRLVGFDYKTSLQSGIYLGQASEFGIIILLSISVLDEYILSSVIILVVLSLIISSYSIKYSQKILKLLLPLLKGVDKFFFTKHYYIKDVSISAPIIFFGYSKENYFLENASFSSKEIFVIENDPSIIKELEEERIKHTFCSTYLTDFLKHIHFKNPEIVVSNMRNLPENMIILRTIKQVNPKALVILYARNSSSALKLYENGADYVVCFDILKKDYIELLLEDFLSDVNLVVDKKVKVIERLKNRKKKEREKKKQLKEPNQNKK